MKNARKLDIGRLIALVTVCEEGSVTAASRKLGIAQPALTVTLTKLEQAIGVQLLTRDARGASPTALGQRFLSSAYELLGMAEMAYKKIHEDSDFPEGEVVIGVPYSCANVLVVPLLTRLAAAYPGIRLRVVESPSAYLWDWLSDGKLDIALLFDRKSSTEVVCEDFAQEDLYLVGSHSLLNLQEINVKRLSEFPLVMASRLNRIRTLLDNHLAGHDLTLNVSIEIDSGEFQVRLIETGNWFGIQAASSVAEKLRTRQLQAALIVPRVTRTICIARHRGKLTDPCVARVITELKQESERMFENGLWPARKIT